MESKLTITNKISLKIGQLEKLFKTTMPVNPYYGRLIQMHIDDLKKEIDSINERYQQDIENEYKAGWSAKE